MSVLDIFRAEATHLTWRRLPDDHVIGSVTGVKIEPDRAYFLLRLTEMYLGRTRSLWRKFYPMVHAFGTFAGKDEHAVVGPGQLQDLGEANLERVVNLNSRLFGPTPYTGGDVPMLVGLYSVPAEDAAKALVSTIGTLAALAGPTAMQASAVVNLVKSGIDTILGLPNTKLRLGIRDTFFPDNPLRAGFHVGIGAPEVDVPLDRIWLRAGRLVIGVDPIVARPYEDSDYMVLQIEARERHPAWPSVPGLIAFEEQFKAILADTGIAVPEKRKQLGQIWPRFTEALHTSPYLTKTDAEFIAENVANDLNRRLKSIEQGNPFETRSAGGTVAREPGDLDFGDIPDYVRFGDARNAAAVEGRLF